MEEDIRRNGKLYLYQKRFGKKWRKVWCVLVAESRRSVARLELYEHKQTSVKETSSKHKPNYKQVIRLRECIRISENKMADCPKDCTTFFLETTDKLYMFAAHQSEVEEWIKSLCEQAFPDTLAGHRLSSPSGIFSETVNTHREIQENSLYETADSVRELLVIAVGTEAAVRCGLYGEYILSPQPDSLILKDSSTRQVLLKWPYCDIRKFGQDTLSFSFEAGRRCESGEGNFEFATHQGERLFSVVNAAIQNLHRISAAKHSNHNHQSRVQETTIKETPEEMYEDITAGFETPDCSTQGRMHRAFQHPSKMLNNAMRNFSLNAIQPSGQVTNIKTNSENEEPVYAMVSKPSPTNPQTHWKNLKKALHHFSYSQDTFRTESDISAVVVPQEEGINEETVIREKTTDFLSDSIHKLAINDTLKSISAEAFYASPQDFPPRSEWDLNAVYHDPEEARGFDFRGNQRAPDETDPLAGHDFLCSADPHSIQHMAAQSNQSSDVLFSDYDNLRIKGKIIFPENTGIQ